jgi:hypothetical protein
LRRRWEWLAPEQDHHTGSYSIAMKSRTDQHLSALLTAEENAAVLNMVGTRAQALATTVAQV